VYNAFINSSADGKNYYNREFSVIDMFPTTLASIGVKIQGNRLGLGTNLFSDDPTLIEKLGKEYFEREIQKRSKYYQNELFYGNIKDKK
jgi:phosphoglycerol transferase